MTGDIYAHKQTHRHTHRQADTERDRQFRIDRNQTRARPCDRCALVAYPSIGASLFCFRSMFFILFPALYLGSGSAVDDLSIRSGTVSKDRVIYCLSGLRSYSPKHRISVGFTDLNRRRRAQGRPLQLSAVYGRRETATNTTVQGHFPLPPLDHTIPPLKIHVHIRFAFAHIYVSSTRLKCLPMKIYLPHTFRFSPNSFFLRLNHAFEI